MNPFDEIARQAAANVLFELPGFRDPPDAARKIVNDILTAAVASIKERGMAREGYAHWGKEVAAFSSAEATVGCPEPVLIIRCDGGK